MASLPPTLGGALLPRDLILLGPECVVDAGVLLGYEPERPVESKTLRVGGGARIRSGSVIYGGTTVGVGLQTGHNVILREENRLGDQVCIWSNTVVDYGCTIGDRVKIHSNVYIPQYTTLEDDVFIAPGCTFANDRFPGCPRAKEVMRGPILEAGARIGVNVTILPGVRVGRGSLIGSGAVVTRDVPPHTVAWGAPARVHQQTGDLPCCEGAPGCPYQPSQESS
ncbi:MAG: N-acetyltransferase [Gemmatimonadota bacterium]|nr:N-acetyltransferase [Gemmatimonadota bacterium]